MTPIQKAKEIDRLIDIIWKVRSYMDGKVWSNINLHRFFDSPQAAAILSGEDWISVGERLPEINEPLMCYNDEGVREVIIPNYEATVLAFDPALGVFKAKINKQHHWTEVSSVSSRGGINVTHWQPLPEPPKP